MRLYWCALIAALVVEASLELSLAAEEGLAAAGESSGAEETGKAEVQEMNMMTKQSKQNNKPAYKVRRKVRLLEPAAQQAPSPSIQMSSGGSTNDIRLNPSISVQMPTPTKAPASEPALAPAPEPKPRAEKSVKFVEAKEQKLPGTSNMLLDSNNVKQSVLRNSGNTESVQIDGVGNSKSTVITSSGNSEQQHIKAQQPHRTPCNHDKLVEHHHHHYETTEMKKKAGAVEHQAAPETSGPLIQVNINGKQVEKEEPRGWKSVEAVGGQLKLGDAFLVPVLKQSALMAEPSAPKRERTGALEMSQRWLERKLSMEGAEKVNLPNFVLVQRSPDGRGLSASPVSFSPFSLPAVVAAAPTLQMPMPVPSMMMPMQMPLRMPDGPMMAPFGQMFAPQLVPAAQFAVPAGIHQLAGESPRGKGYGQPRILLASSKPTSVAKEATIEEQPTSTWAPTSTPTSRPVTVLPTTTKPTEVIEWETVRIPKQRIVQKKKQHLVKVDLAKLSREM